MPKERLSVRISKATQVRPPEAQVVKNPPTEDEIQEALKKILMLENDYQHWG